jgi:hypothetical protein
VGFFIFFGKNLFRPPHDPKQPFFNQKPMKTYASAFQKPAAPCYFPTTKSLKRTFLKIFFHKKSLACFFGKQFEKVRKQAYNATAKSHSLELHKSSINPKPIALTMKNAQVIPALLLTLASVLNLNAQSATPTFQDFLAQFPTASLPYTFDAQALQGQLEARSAAKATRLGWDFYQFLPELERSAEFSSMPVHPEPVAAFETEKYHAVLYNIARGLTRGTKTYSISVFDKQGNYIGTHFVAGVNPEHLTVATIDEQLNADVKEFKVNWAADYRENGPIGNSITGLTLLEMQTLELSTAGNPDQIEWTSRSTETNVNLAKMK